MDKDLIAALANALSDIVMTGQSGELLNPEHCAQVAIETIAIYAVSRLDVKPEGEESE